MGQADILELLKKYKPNKLTAKQIRVLLNRPTLTGAISRCLMQLRRWNLVRYAYVKNNNTYKYLYWSR